MSLKNPENVRSGREASQNERGPATSTPFPGSPAGVSRVAGWGLKAPQPCHLPALGGWFSPDTRGRRAPGVSPTHQDEGAEPPEDSWLVHWALQRRAAAYLMHTENPAQTRLDQ